VLVVCKGNVCRSPLAEVVLADVLGPCRVRSRALTPSAGGPAALKVREYAARVGYSLEDHRACPLLDEDLAWADVILYMSEANLRGLELRDAWPAVVSRAVRVRSLGSYIGIDRIADPGFLPRGPRLEAVLGIVVQASLAAARSLA